MLVNGHPPIVLSATTEGAYANRVELTVKGSVPGEGLDIPVNTVFVHREQILENEGVHDILQIQNFHSEKAHLVIEITYDSDFMDIFQVRRILRGKGGRYFEPLITEARITFVYEGLDDRVRTTALSFDPTPSRISRHAGIASGLLFGVVPVRQVLRANPYQIVKSGRPCSSARSLALNGVSF